MFKNWKIKENLIKVIKTYPVVLCSFFAIGILSIYLIHSEANEDIILRVNFSIAVFLGSALVLKSLKLKYKKFSSKIYIILLAVCMLLSFGLYFTIDPDIEWTIIRTLIILFIEGLLFISLPFLKDDERAEHFVNQAAGRLVISGILFGIAYGGVAGILFALEELFGLDISYKIYNDAGVILSTTFLPMLWLFGLDYSIEPKKSKLYKVLLCFVCIPLLFIYSGVVYGYILKMVFDGFVMPSSIVGHLVLWYSFASIIVTYLTRPYQEDNSLTKFFYKWYPIISTLPIVIMFIAIFLRINQYGITINRYYLLLGGIWLAIMFAYLIFVRFANKKRLNVVTTLLIALFALFSIAEPISADAVSQNSQLKRLGNIIDEYRVSGVVDVSIMEDEDVIQVNDIILYLRRSHEGYGENNYADGLSYKKVYYLSQDEINNIREKAVELDKENLRDGRNYYYIHNSDGNRVTTPIDVQGYRYLLNISSQDFNNGDLYEIDNYGIQVKDVLDNGGAIVDYEVIIYENGEVVTALQLVKCFGMKLLEKRNNFGSDKNDFVYETSDGSLKIVLYEINFWIDKNTAVTWFDGCILLK